MFVRRNKGALCDFVTHINELPASITKPKLNEEIDFYGNIWKYDEFIRSR
jgi:hypothetical protein